MAFPAFVREASLAMMQWDVPVDGVADLVSDGVFELVPTREGMARVTLLVADYRSGDWGPSTYAGLTLPVRPAGDDLSATGVRLCHGVTNAAFTDEVMYWALGVAGALGELDVVYGPHEVTARVATAGEDALRVQLRRPTTPGGGLPLGVDMYTCAGKSPLRVRYELDAPVGPLDPGGVRLEAGTGPLADAVVGLGLLRPPDSCTWGEHLSMTIHRPQPLVADSTSPTPSRLHRA